MDLQTTPFESHMLRDAQTFVGRWSELQHLIHAIDQRRPVIVIAPPQSGRSSLLFHAVAAGAVLLDYDELPAFYLDMAEFPDVAAVACTIAEAFAPPGTPWQLAILRTGTAPLLALDNIDAPQFAESRLDWQAQLATEVRAGRLRIIAAAEHPDAVVPDWQRVDLAPVGQSFLREYLDVTLPDGPHPSRADQQFIVNACHGHLGTLILLLTLWYRSLKQPDFDWRTVAVHLSGENSPPLTVPALPAAASAHVGDMPTGGELLRPVNDAVESSKHALRTGLVGMRGWVILVALVVVFFLWYWGSR